MEGLTEFIQNVGFPIVCCYFMFKQNEKLQSSLTELIVTLKGIDSRLTLIEKEAEERKG